MRKWLMRLFSSTLSDAEKADLADEYLAHAIAYMREWRGDHVTWTTLVYWAEHIKSKEDRRVSAHS